MVSNQPLEEQKPDSRNALPANIAPENNSDNAAAALTILLEHMTGYFRKRGDADDLDALVFSLRHLFGRVNDLYRFALPAVMESHAEPDHERSFTEILLLRQHLWTHLRSVKFAVSRIEPLCHLLNNASERLLDALDNTDSAATIASDDTIPRPVFPDDEPAWLPPAEQERWEHAFTIVMTTLRQWHEYYSLLVPFTAQFAHLVSSLTDLPRLDETFSVLLDCTGAIFGDIVPGFLAISANDDEAVCVLLLDLMQQSDQLQAQFDIAITPLQALIEQYAPGPTHS